MKKILVKVGVGLGVLILIALIALVLVRKRTTECRQGQGSVAIEACSFLIDTFPKDTILPYLDLRRGHYAVAGAKQAELDDLKRMISLVENAGITFADPYKASVYEKAAEAYAKNGDKPASLKAAEQAIQLGSKDGGVHMMRGLARLETEKYAEAVADFKAAEAFGFKQLQLYMSLGAAYLGAADYLSAYQVLKKCESMAVAPQDVGLINRQLGLTSFELKSYQEALDHMTKALLAGPCPDCSAVIKMSQEFLKPKPAPRKKTRRR